MNTPWPKVRLGEVLRHRKEFITIDDLTVYKRPRVQLHAKGIVLRDEVQGALLKTKTQQVCQAGEFLVAEIDAKVGGYGIVPEATDGAIVSSHYFLFIINEPKLDRRFLNYYIRTQAFRSQVEAQGSTNYAAIRPADVLGYEIPLPAIAEQRRIVARIEELAAKLEEARTLRQEAADQTGELWPSVLRGILVGEGCRAPQPKRGTGADLLLESSKRNRGIPKAKHNNAHPDRPIILQSGPSILPVGWVWTTLGSVLTHLVDCVNDTPNFADHDTGFIGLKSTNVRPYRLDLRVRWFMRPDDFTAWNRREQPRSRDVVLTREAPMGYACILPDGYRICLTQRLMLLRADPDAILPELLLHYLNSPHFYLQAEERSRGLTTPHIRVQDAPNFVLPLPPMDEQRRIVAELEGLQTEVDKLNRSHAETAAELDALLPSILDKAFKREL